MLERSTLQNNPRFSAHKSGRYVVDVSGFLRGKEGDLVDLHAFFTDHSSSVEVMPITSNVMRACGLIPGGFMLISTSIKPSAGSIVVVRYNSQVVVRRLIKKEGRWRLTADDPKEKDLLINNYTSVEKIGVVIAASVIF